MSRRPEGATVVFAVLGALLLTYLGLPLIYLFVRVEWTEIISTLGDPRALRAVRVSLITSPVFLWVQLTSEGLRGALPLALLLLALAGGAIAAIYLVRLLHAGVAAVELTKFPPATQRTGGSAEVR